MSFIFREEPFICVKVLVSKLHSTDLTELLYALIPILIHCIKTVCNTKHHIKLCVMCLN